MIKYFFSLIVTISIINTAFGKTADTAVMYFGKNGYTVQSFDQSEYYMLITPPDANDTRYNIRECYRSGTLKLTGKSDGHENVMKTGSVRLDGECISYFQNGKKSSICHYNQGYKEGIEEMYYPNESLYCRIKHTMAMHSKISGENFYLDCYDLKGIKICDAGNGRWLVYDDSCQYVIQEGPIKKSYREGDWSGKIFTPDTIRYIYTYKQNLIQSSVGYDKNGKAYPFTDEFEKATYRSGPLVFLERLRNRIKLPKDTDGKKMSIDTMHISFVVERDGKLSQFSISGNVDVKLQEAVFAALEKSNEWIPSKVYGVPFRTRIILPLGVVSGWNTKYKGWESYHKEIWYNEAIIKD